MTNLDDNAKLMEDNSEMRKQLELSLQTQQRCRAVVDSQKKELQAREERITSLESELAAERTRRVEL